jgi:hypothetical protein
MSQKRMPGRMSNPEKYRMNFCHECHGLGKTFDKKNSKEFRHIWGVD